MTSCTSPHVFVGIDIAKSWIDISLHGQHQRLDNTPAAIKLWLATLPQNATLVYEPTGGYETVLEQAVKPFAFRLKRVHPTRVRAFARACSVAKTDKLDAALLARFGQFDTTPEQIPADPVTLQLNRRRRQLVDMLQAERQRKSRMDPCLHPSLDAVIALLVLQLADIDKQLNTAIENNPNLSAQKQLLQSFKGVGSTTANILLASLPELGRRGKKQLASLVGLAPQTKDSGLKKGYAKTGHGRAEVRKALYMASLVGLRHNKIIKAFYQKLRAAGKSAKVALTACMHKVLIILNAILTSKQPWLHA